MKDQEVWMRPGARWLNIREEIFQLFGYDQYPAITLTALISWNTNAQNNHERATDKSEQVGFEISKLLLRKSCLGMVSIRKIDESVETMISMGFLKKKAPENPGDRCSYFLDVSALNRLLKKLPASIIPDPDLVPGRKNHKSYVGIDADAMTASMPTMTASMPTLPYNELLELPGGMNVPPNNTPFGAKNKILESDVTESNEQERLGSDLEYIEESEDHLLQEKSEKDYGAASDLRTKSGGWTLQAEKDFKTQFRKLRGAKINKRELEWTRQFFERQSISPEDARIAIDGFRESEDHTLRAFRKEFYLCKTRGETLQEALPPPETVPTDHTPTADALRRAETAKNPVSEIIERWNLLVPSSPVTDWTPKRDDEMRLRYLLRDADFMAAFDGIASKCESIHRTKSNWAPTFRWLLKKNCKVDNWWRIQSGEFDWAMKPKSKHKNNGPDGDRVDQLLREQLGIK